ncbi:sigma-70 family RNA polymerase sigma factor [bacterium]|nr:sigma-70 family RNA polymerase sigma factor [bacterium]MCB2179243.1 sigma-70 family RNA polymerase sigma factor [bacterium]
MPIENREEETALVRRAQHGDQSAFEEIVRRNARYVYNLALRLTQNPQEADDLSQEAFVRVWKALPNFRTEARFRTWLYRIVTNLCYDRLPKLRKELAALDNDLLDQAPLPRQNQPEHALLTKEEQMRLYTTIENLPQHYRLLITLRHLQELSYTEIAEATGQPLGTVKAGIYRARQFLRERLEEHEQPSN